MKAHGLNPRIRKSPFFASTIKYGATEFHPYNGMWMPVGYDTPVNEYWNTIERAGLWDVAVQRIVERQVTRWNEKVGEVSSAVFSPRLEKNIGFALLDSSVFEDPGNLKVDTAEGVRDITLTEMPFVDPGKSIPRQSLR